MCHSKQLLKTMLMQREEKEGEHTEVAGVEAKTKSLKAVKQSGCQSPGCLYRNEQIYRLIFLSVISNLLYKEQTPPGETSCVCG